MKIIKYKNLLLLVVLFAANGIYAQKNAAETNFPFPQTQTLEHCAIPNHVGRDRLNADVTAYYDYWKERYLKPSVMKGGYYIEGETTNATVPDKGTSEGQGFGMIITTLMAGYDDSAKIYYDGLYRFFDAHRSILNNELMGWLIAEDERSNAFDCATDGDMDIAYSLLLAHKQWGSGGEINYLQEAKDMITLGLKKSCVDHKTMRIVLGDWDTLATGTRSSDWMTAQIRAYGKATGDTFWAAVNDTIYAMIEHITKNYSPKTALVPDFATGMPVRPAGDNFLEKNTDDDFSWNACRYPMRIGLDYILYKAPESKKVLTKLTNWAIEYSSGDPAKFTSTYTLGGKPLATYTSTAFTSPLLVACTIDKKNQEYLNKGWEFIKDNKYQYYNDCINLMCMLAISGNWWTY